MLWRGYVREFSHLRMDILMALINDKKQLQSHFRESGFALTIILDQTNSNIREKSFIKTSPFNPLKTANPREFDAIATTSDAIIKDSNRLAQSIISFCLRMLKFRLKPSRTNISFQAE